ncbi:MAG: DUF3352 domain-containing protein, partial [Candidatus Omnitrophica bacterium]|nr:DUF3352 domain-containing protein [Candidatus Omnitrophota bacterium]
NTIALEGTNITIAYVVIKDLLAVSVGENMPQKIVDVFKREELSLDLDNNFKDARTRYMGSHNLSGYMDVARVISGIEELARGKIPAEQRGEWDNVFGNFKGIRYLGFSSKVGDISNLNYSFVLDKNEMPPEIARQYSCPADENRSLNLIPKDIIAYMWGNCFDAGFLWKRIKQETASAKQKDEGKKAKGVEDFESALGIDVEKELIPSLGNELGGYLGDIDNTGLFPIPQLVIFIEVENQTVIEGLLTKFTQNPMFVLQKEEYSGSTLNYVSIPISQSLKPSYAFVGKYLLIAVNNDSIKASIDVLNKKSESLLSNVGFKEIDRGLSGSNHYLFYADTGLLLDKARKTMEWGNALADGKDKERQAFADGTKQKLEELSEEILTAKNSLEAFQKEEENLKKQLDAARTQGLAEEELVVSLDQAGKNVKSKQAEVDTLVSKRDSISASIEEYSKKAPKMTQEQRKVLMEAAVYPALDAFSGIGSLGIRSTIKDNHFDTDVYLKIKK